LSLARTAVEHRARIRTARICIGVLDTRSADRRVDRTVIGITNLCGAPRDTCETTMEATMLAHTPTLTRKRRAVEFHAMRSPRDMLLSLPIVDGEAARLAPKQVLDALAVHGRA